MAKNPMHYRVRVLCEDNNHYHFIRSFLGTQGFNERRIVTSFDLPEGSQSGEQFVRQHFAGEYKEYAHGEENVLLVVMQDIDTAHRQPKDAMDEFNKLVGGTIAVSDKLLMAFPKRNIETWFEWIKHDPPRVAVNESMDYRQKHFGAKPARLGKEAGAIYNTSRNDASVCDNAPASLLHACNEFVRLCDIIRR